MQQKVVSDFFIILVNNQKQPLHARNYFKSKILKEDYQKALKKATLFFLLNPVPFNRQFTKNKKDLELVTSRYLGYETSSEKFPY